MGMGTPAVAADSLVLGTPLEAQLANFGAASYPVFNSITDVSPLVDKLVAFVDKKVKAPDAAELASTAVDGLLAIPDAKVSEYAGVLKQVVYSGVSSGTCVSLGGSGDALSKISASEKLWVAQAELTASMPKEQAAALSASIKKAGAQANRASIVALVPGAAEVFSKSPEAIGMVAAGKSVEATIIATAAAALK